MARVAPPARHSHRNGHMKPRILVPYDFGSSSAKALEWAADLQGTVGGLPVHVIHVVNPLPPLISPEVVMTLSEQDLGEIAASLKRAVQTIHIAATTELVSASSPGHAIVDAATRVKADLIAMGTHGRTGLARLVLGSVAEYVVRHAPCPVVTIRAAPAESNSAEAS
jgi:universal stress protein A